LGGNALLRRGEPAEAATHIDPDGEQFGPGDVQKQSPNAPQRPADDRKPPGSELTALPGVIAALLAVLETVWWWSDGIFSS